MIILAGADLVLPDRIISPGTLVIDGGRIAEVIAGARSGDASACRIDLREHYVVPGFIDVHVHGAEGYDTLDGPGAVAAIAARLPRYGVVAFCPTTVACPPSALRATLSAVRQARATPVAGSARVLPAHLESNFISPDFRGAQPLECLRVPPARVGVEREGARTRAAVEAEAGYDGSDVLAEIERARPDIGIVTMAPELPGGLELVRALVGRGIRVSLGHSGADFEQGQAAVAAGARHAAHLFNRMRPFGHRDPGLVGAVLHSEEVAAEIICDGHHVHPAVVRMTVAAKHPARVMAVTDGTAGSGLPVGSRARLGGQAITMGDHAAHLLDGTLAGSTTTMDSVFRLLAGAVGLAVTDAAVICATTAARELGLQGHGVIAPGAVADLVVLDRQLRVAQTYIGGVCVFDRNSAPAGPVYSR